MSITHQKAFSGLVDTTENIGDKFLIVLGEANPFPKCLFLELDELVKFCHDGATIPFIDAFDGGRNSNYITF